jgi:hypothetical protein
LINPELLILQITEEFLPQSYMDDGPLALFLPFAASAALFLILSLYVLIDHINKKKQSSERLALEFQIQVKISSKLLN